jgi:zinc and cadmium transporter
MSTLSWIVFFTIAGGALSALAAGVFLLAPDKARNRLIPHLVSFATGVLLGAAFMRLLPGAFEGFGPDRIHAVGLTVLAGLLVFFLLEKLVLWRHCHHDECDAHSGGHSHAASGRLILIGDAMHNFVDGVLIAAAFLTDFHLGVATSVAVIAHEIPQEVGDLAILLHSGFSRLGALTLNLLVSLTSVLGGVLGYMWLDNTRAFLPYALAVAASSFIYVAVADLIPGLHKRVDFRSALAQITLIAAGIGVIEITHRFTH